MSRRIKVLLSAAIVVLAGAGVMAGAGTASGADPQQFTLFDATGVNTARSYFQPVFSSPANWSSPINYAGGTAYWRFQVVNKPSSLPMRAQVCMWRENYTVETCGPLANSPVITDEGTYWVNLGSVANWWKKNNNWALIPPQNVRIMLKDVQSGLQLQTSACGAYCYPRGDLASHVPIDIKSSFVVVAKGATLSPLAGWNGCPAAWSPQCPAGGTGTTTTSSGGGTTTTTKATTTTTSGGGVTTTTKAPATTTTTKPTTPTGVTVSIADGRVTEPDTGSVSLPFKLYLNKVSTSPVTVSVVASNGTAVAPGDYSTRGRPIVITIPAGSTSAWVGFPVNGDTTKEANETIYAKLSAPSGATIADGTALGTIVNDD